MTWDYDKQAEDKQAAQDPAWKLERQILFGDGEEKMDRLLLAQYLPKLRIPENRRAFLELLLWNKPF
ncbi:MAG: hypothetical protein WC802_04985 [Patescibacteria group bacterium]|jgi:hypothetical protein